MNMTCKKKEKKKESKLFKLNKTQLFQSVTTCSYFYSI